MTNPITCDDVNRYIFSIAPDPKPAAESENVYACGDPNTVCTGVAVAWWPGPDILREAVKQRLNFIVSHEDPIMEIYHLPILPHRSPMPETLSIPANRERMRLATENNLIIHRHHWNIDLAPWGIPAAFIEEVGWSKNIVLSEKCLRIVELHATPLAQVAEHVKSCLKLPFVRVVSPSPGHLVRRIGIAPGGSGQGWGTPAQYESLGCDTIIVGDMIHACAKMAAECGLAVIDGFHHATEEPGLRVLAKKIAKQFPSLPVKFFEEPMPWQAL